MTQLFIPIMEKKKPPKHCECQGGGFLYNYVLYYGKAIRVPALAGQIMQSTYVECQVKNE